jgi:hypothetical protein
MTAGVLCEAEDAGKVHVDDGFPVLFRVNGGRRAANDSGVVDQDVDGAEVLDGFFNQARADLSVAHVADESDCVMADFRDALLRGCRRSRRAMNGDFCASFSQRDRDGRSEPAGGAGHQRDLVLEGELFEYQGNLSFLVGQKSEIVRV